MTQFEGARNSHSNITDVLPVSNAINHVVGVAETLLVNPDPANYRRLVLHNEVVGEEFRARLGDYLERTFLDGEVIVLADSATITAHGYANGDGPYQLINTGAALAGTPGVIIAADDTLTRDAGSWLDEGFVVGQTVTLGGSASNNGALTILLVTDLVITTTEDITVAEGTQTDLTLTAAGEALPTGLALLTDYYIHAVDNNTLTFHTSAAGAKEVTGSTANVASRVDITAVTAGGVHSIGGLALAGLDDLPATTDLTGLGSFLINGDRPYVISAPKSLTVIGGAAASVLTLWWTP